MDIIYHTMYYLYTAFTFPMYNVQYPMYMPEETRLYCQNVDKKH